jgi:hypothetical protein
MEWVLRLTSGVVVLLLLAPLAVLLGGLILFGIVGHLLPKSLIRSRKTFGCPYSNQQATVDFLSPLESEQPSDVLSCSVFANPSQVRCQKRCLTMTETAWAPSAMMPRYSLLADGVAYRPVALPDRPHPEGDMPQAA